MAQEQLDSFKAKHVADEIMTATPEEVNAFSEYLNEVGAEAAAEFLGGAPKSKAKKAKK